MSTDIAKFTAEAELAQVEYDELLNIHEKCSGVEKIRLASRLTASLMRRDDTLAALSLALRAPQNADARRRQGG
jgi:hypothetical protein